MGDIVDMEAFKQRRVTLLEDEFSELLTQADRLKRSGKHQFAQDLLNRAKDVQQKLKKARIARYLPPLDTVSDVTNVTQPHWMSMPSPDITYTFSTDRGDGGLKPSDA